MKIKTLPLLTFAALTMSVGSIVAQPINDNCSGATTIQSAFGNPIGVITTLGPYDNTLATVDPSDPIDGFECYGEPDGGGASPTIDNNIWFTFIGDGGKYFIETGNGAGVTNYIDDGDTQISIYTGACGALVPFACNEDGPNVTTTTFPAGLSITTTPGTVYYLMIDGFNFNGAISSGEFLVFVNQQAVVACGDTSITAGVMSALDPTVCFGDTLFISTSGGVAPSVGTTFGFAVIVSSDDISGNNDPLSQPGILGGTGAIYPVPPTVNTSLPNTGNPFPDGVYYFTPVVFGNATGTGNITALTLDPACTYTGASVMVILYAAGDPACSVGINEINNNGLGLSAYQSSNNEMNITINAAKQAAVTVNVYDLTGRVVIAKNITISQGLNSQVLDITNLSTGTYVIKINDGSNVATGKMIRY